MLKKLAEKRMNFYLVVSLIIFLPFSSWLVSLSGQPAVSLVRDILVVLLFFTVLPTIKWNKLKSPLIWLIASYILWIVISYFWVQADFWQWLHGVRFSATPMLFLFTLLLSDFTPAEKRSIFRSAIWMSSIIVVIAILELVGLKLPLVTAASSQGTLSADHFVGAANLHRLQSVLAGPNALGLYLLVSIALVFVWGRKLSMPKWLTWAYTIVAILTFSRSVWVGLIVLLLAALVLYLKLNTRKFIEIVLVLFIVAAGLFFVADKSPTLNQIFTHGVSTSERLTEYKRIWQEKNNIGLLGRGAGGAGPTTQDRLDIGPNYWTENTYLDTFEEFGLVGLLLFLSVFILIWSNVLFEKSQDDTIDVPRLILPAFLAAGLFINFYTGQVAVFTFLLTIGLSDAKLDQKK